MKKRIRIFFENGLTVLIVLLIFFALFQKKLVVPYWMQPIGRTHPLILHFPIVLLLLYAFLEFFRSALDVPKKLTRLILLAGALTATFTAIAGLFLSKEPGYESDLIEAHKWWGVIAAIISGGLYYLKSNPAFKNVGIKTGALLLSVCLIFTGHFGAGITHGSDFLFAPLLGKVSEEDTVSLKSAVVYDHVVMPVFRAKCVSCHNPEKRKGKLDLTTAKTFLKGGEDGPIVNMTNPADSKLTEVIALPLAHDDHMPPEGKPQLTKQEIQLLNLWVRSGAAMKSRIIDIPAVDTLRQLSETLFKSGHEANHKQLFGFQPAESSKVMALNTPNRSVAPIAKESPALKVIFYNKGSFSSEMLNELNSVRKNVVDLDLHNMPVQDRDLKIIARFENLRALNLNYTAITNDGLKQLALLKNLERISLSGTAVTASDLNLLATCPSLKEIFVWNTKVKTSDIAVLQNQFRKVTFQTGFEDDGAVLKLPPPRVVNEVVVFSQPLKLELFNPIQGTQIRYTIDNPKIDSANGNVYSPDKGILISQSSEIRAQAFKDGWAKSDVVTFPVVRNALNPDSISFVHQPNSRYKGRGAQSLVDKQLAQPSIWHPGWVGFYDNPLELVLRYNKAVQISAVSFSFYLDIGSYIFPPEKIEIWSGEELNNMELVTSIIPVQPKKNESNRPILLNCNFEPHRASVMRIVAKPIHSLPQWHPGKGQRGHIFIDEIGIN